MASTINTNIMSLNAQRNLSTTQGSLAVTMQRLSSGLRVNSAKDDAAGLAIATRMNAQIRGMNVAVRNANDGISYSQTAEGALGSVSDSLQRMRELVVQARNGSNSSKDLTSIGEEFKQLGKEIGRVLGGTQFNGKSVFASTSSSLTFQVGANKTSNDTIKVTTTKLSSNSSITNVTSKSITGSSTTSALGSMITLLDTAIDKINSERATFGAVQSRFEAVISSLQNSVENQSAARGRIMDADFAAETSNLSRTQVLQQAGNAMVAMANQMPAQVLQLLG